MSHLQGQHHLSNWGLEEKFGGGAEAWFLKVQTFILVIGSLHIMVKQHQKMHFYSTGAQTLIFTGRPTIVGHLRIVGSIQPRMIKVCRLCGDFNGNE